MIYFVGSNLIEYENVQNCSLQDMYDYCVEQKRLGLDIETSRKFKKNKYREDVYRPGLDPFLTNICMIQIGTLEKVFVIDVRAFDKALLIKYLKPLLENKNIQKVGHNLKFEGSFILHHLGIRLINVWDTFIIEKLLYNGLLRSNSLAALMYRYLNIKPVQKLNLFESIADETTIEREVKRILDFAFLSGLHISEEEALSMAEEKILKEQYVNKDIRMGFVELGSKPFTQEMVEYGAEDITAPLKIQEIQSEGREINGKSWFPKNGALLENKTTQVLAEAELQGVSIDTDLWQENHDNNTKTLFERKKKLDDFVIKNNPKYCSSIDLFTKEPGCAIQWTSSHQVIPLFRELGICGREKSASTGKIEWTVGAKALFRMLPNKLKGNFFKMQDVEIVDTSTLILQYLLFKKSEQLVTTFGSEWLKYIHPLTGKVHTGYNQLMISTRLSSTNPNLQQIPNTKLFRRCFIAGKGNWWSSLDYAGQELRIAADVHNVRKMIEFFRDGDEKFGADFHSFSATQMFKVIHNNPDYVVPPKEFSDGSKNPEFTKQHGEERTKSKNLTFKLNYGGSAYTVALDLGISEEEADKYIANFFKGLPGMLDSFNKKKRDATRNGYVELDLFTGKRYFYPGFDKMEELKKQAYSLTDFNPGQKIPEAEKKRLREETEWSAIWKEFMILKGKLERRALNLPIQGAAASMMKLAALFIYDWRWQNNLQDKIHASLYVHDEANVIMYGCSEEQAKEWSETIKNYMILAGSYICKKVPMDADYSVAHCWVH